MSFEPVATTARAESATASRSPLLSMRGVSKRFPGVLALSGVSIDVYAGEVLALMGENGAGKSTLMNVLGGVLTADEGEFTLSGAPISLGSVRAAKGHGIALIHQELMLAPNLDIASNIFLGNERKRLLQPLARAEMHRRAVALLARVGLRLPPTTPVSTLTTGQQQLVEVAKALSVESRIIVMDEPTSSLAAAESEQLFAIIHQLRADGIGIVYISHRMEEVLALSDRISVMRDGRNAGELSRADASYDKIVALMVGRELSGAYFPTKTEKEPGEVMLTVEGLHVPGAPGGVSFSVRRGEILGFAGLVGSGRTELMEALFGVTPGHGGRMTVDGRPFSPSSPRDAIARGVYLVPEDRKRHGLVLPMSVSENASLPSVQERARFGVVNRSADQRLAEAEVKRLHIKTPSVHQQVVTLSGGNQQKVVIGKWLAMSPKVLILDEPTRGIDVGAKAEIYRHMAELAAQGIAILMVSSDLEEVIGMTDRVVVMHERRLKGVLERAQLTQQLSCSQATERAL